MQRRKRRATDPTKAVALIRVSTEQQAQSGLGLDDQRHAIERWARQHNVAIVAWHEEHCSASAEREEREELTEAIQAVGAHSAGWLVVLRRDRLARDPLVAMMVERELGGHGAMVACADGSTTGNEPVDDFQARVFDAMNKYERDMIAARTRAALAARRRQGAQPSGSPPYGYRWEHGALVPEPREQHAIGRIHQLRGAGESLRAVADILNREGYATRHGASWHRSQVHGIVRRATDD